MWSQMGWVAKGVAFVLFFMSMWSFGVAIERIYTFAQARSQSKLFAPQVAKHLKDADSRRRSRLSSSKTIATVTSRRSFWRGCRYPFQQESGGGLSREDLADTGAPIDSARRCRPPRT
jgi:biopolymer transport protein ExbB/TolQ